MSLPRTVEICVTSAEEAVAASEGGASRVELCRDRSVGGLSPDWSQVEQAARSIPIPVHVLIRTRAGDFCYSPDEWKLMKREIRQAQERGAAGIVIGATDPEGRIEFEPVRELMALAGPLSVTYHKAFDVNPDPRQGLEQLVELGAGRVLTSGLATTVQEGMETLRNLVRQANGRLAIMAGGSITWDDLPRLHAIGIQEIHAGSLVLKDGATDARLVRRLVDEWTSLADDEHMNGG